MIDVVRLTWVALREAGEPSSDSLAVAPLPAPAKDALRLGIDERGHEHLLVRIADATSPLPDLAEGTALTATLRTWRIGGVDETVVDIECGHDAAREAFDHFVVAIWDRLEHAGSQPLEAVAHVFGSWREFLTTGATPPSANRVRGIVGELLVVRDLATLNPNCALAAWVGSSGQRHDFRSGARAIEVKTTASHTARVVSVHGVDQLEAPAKGELMLHFVRLEPVPSGALSVPDLVDQLLEMGCASEPLFKGLAASGITGLGLSAAGTHRFEVRERTTFKIAPQTPRIVASSFVGGNPPTAVVDLRYQLDLQHLLEFVVDTEWPAYLAQIAKSAESSDAPRAFQ